MILACPDSVSITFFGFRSRCTTPRACASTRPSATSIARSSARPGSIGAPAIEAESGRPRTSSIAMKVDAFGLVDLVDHGDRGVRERGGRARLLLQAALLLGVAHGGGTQDLERDLAAQGRVEGAVDDPHAPRARSPRARDSARASCRSSPLTYAILGRKTP